MTSLRTWAIENKIWEPESWREFLKEDILPFYEDLKIILEIHKQLEEVTSKNCLADVEDDELKKKIVTAIYGGVEESPEKSFAKLMFDYFGVGADNASSFEESIKHYREYGDGVKVSVRQTEWIEAINKLAKDDSSLLYGILEKLCEKLNIQKNDVLPKPPSREEVISYLPSPGEKPEKLVNLINRIRKKAVDLAIGRNPYTTFVFYARAIPAYALMKFLGCNKDELARLVEFLELKAYSMTDLKEVKLPTNHPEKALLIRSYGCLAHKILRLQWYLGKIEPKANEVFRSMIESSIDRVKVVFEPWDEYKELFELLKNVLENHWKNTTIYVVNGKVMKIHQVYKVSEEVELQDFLLRLYPAVSTGVIDVSDISYNGFNLYFYPLLHEFEEAYKYFVEHAKKWLAKVISYEGKT